MRVIYDNMILAAVKECYKRRDGYDDLQDMFHVEHEYAFPDGIFSNIQEQCEYFNEEVPEWALDCPELSSDDES